MLGRGSRSRDGKVKNKTPLTRTEILARLRKNEATLKKYKVRRIGLFGSFAKGKQHRKSDLDFLVEFDEPTLDNFMDLAGYLEKLFRRNIDLLTPAGVESMRVKAVAENIKKSLTYV